MDIGALDKDILLQNPSTPVPDGDGGFTQTFTDLAPVWWASIKPATARDLERSVSGTVLSTATHLIRMWYLAGVTTKTRVLWNGRTFNVTGVTNVDENDVELILACAEVVE